MTVLPSASLLKSKLSRLSTAMEAGYSQLQADLRCELDTVDFMQRTLDFLVANGETMKQRNIEIFYKLRDNSMQLRRAERSTKRVETVGSARKIVNPPIILVTKPAVDQDYDLVRLSGDNTILNILQKRRLSARMNKASKKTMESTLLDKIRNNLETLTHNTANVEEKVVNSKTAVKPVFQFGSVNNLDNKKLQNSQSATKFIKPRTLVSPKGGAINLKSSERKTSPSQALNLEKIDEKNRKIPNRRENPKHSRIDLTSIRGSNLCYKISSISRPYDTSALKDDPMSESMSDVQQREHPRSSPNRTAASKDSPIRILVNLRPEKIMESFNLSPIMKPMQTTSIKPSRSESPPPALRR